MAVSKRLRYEILRRDNHACRYCGGVAPSVVLTVDHVVPTTLGGKDDPSNLVTACRDCNSGKSATPADASLVADVAQDALRWTAAIKQATARALEDRDRQIEVEKDVFAVFNDVPVPSYRGGGTLAAHLPGDWFESIRQFLAGGLDSSEIVDAARIASARNVRENAVWRYFCGVCWRKVERRHEEAFALLRPTSESGQEEDPHCEHEDCAATHECKRCGQTGCVWACGEESGEYYGWRDCYDRHAYEIYQGSVLAAVVDQGGWTEPEF